VTLDEEMAVVRAVRIMDQDGQPCECACSCGVCITVGAVLDALRAKGEDAAASTLNEFLQDW